MSINYIVINLESIRKMRNEKNGKNSKKFYFGPTKWQLKILITFDNNGKRTIKYSIIVRRRINR